MSGYGHDLLSLTWPVTALSSVDDCESMFLLPKCGKKVGSGRFISSETWYFGAIYCSYL